MNERDTVSGWATKPFHVVLELSFGLHANNTCYHASVIYFTLHDAINGNMIQDLKNSQI